MFIGSVLWIKNSVQHLGNAYYGSPEQNLWNFKKNWKNRQINCPPPRRVIWAYNSKVMPSLSFKCHFSCTIYITKCFYVISGLLVGIVAKKIDLEGARPQIIVPKNKAILVIFEQKRVFFSENVV